MTLSSLFFLVRVVSTVADVCMLVVVHLRIIVVRFSHISPKYVVLPALCLSGPVIPFKVWKDEGYHEF